MSDTGLVPAVAVALLVVTAGCTGLTGSDDVASAEEIRSQTVASMEDVETYRMSMEMTVRASGQEIPLSMNGTFDRAAEKAAMTTSAQGQTVESYVDGSTMYVQAPQGWQAQDISDEEPWNQSTALERQRAIMENAEITDLGEDTLDGEPVYVVRVNPEEERVKQVAAQQGTTQMGGVSIDDVTYTQYVHRETDNLVQVDMNMTMEVNGQSADVTATITFDGYDEPTDITIPEDARAAGSLAPVAA